MTQFPPPPGSPGYPPQMPFEPPPNVDGKIKGPAIALIVVGALGGLGCLYRIVMGLVFGGAAMAGQIDQMRRSGAPDQVIQIVQATSSGALTVIFGILFLLLNGLTIWGGTSMLRKQAWGLAVAGAIVQCISCAGPCCCLGIPFGIWALIVLFNDNVKASFR